MQSHNIVCQCGEDVLISSTLICSHRDGTVSGALTPANINWLPVLSNIDPPHIRHDRATVQEYKKAQQLTDGVTIEQVLREPPKSRIRPRRPFVMEAARFVSLNQTEQEIWEQ